MAANFSVLMNSCEYRNNYIIRSPLKERIAGTTFLEINIVLLEELFKQWMTESSPVKINTMPIEQWLPLD